MRIVLILAHSIEEFDQLKLLSELGNEVFSIGGYINPAEPHDKKRPALPAVPCFRGLKEAVDKLGTDNNLEAAKRYMPDEILEWAEVIICHHYEANYLLPQWDRIKKKRVIWRTVGQSVENNERTMKPLRDDGLQIVRYSPKEENIPGYLGGDALIRFYKDPDEWNGWTGENREVINFTQSLRQRHPYTNWEFWEGATSALPRTAYGPGSEVLGGPGEMTTEAMRETLRRNRCYLYTGTQPASYTLGLIEAMMIGIPVISIGPAWMNVFPYGPQLFEGHEIAGCWSNNPNEAREMVIGLLERETDARNVSALQRAKALSLFGKQAVAAQWKEFLGSN